MKRFVFFAAICLVICLTGCNAGAAAVSITEETTSTVLTEPEILGVVTEQQGSIEDYVGLWQLTESDTVPFYTIEIKSDGSVQCRDENGNISDTGYADYDEQRALTGNPPVVFYFDSNREAGAAAFSLTDGERYLDIDFTEKTATFIYLGTDEFSTEEAFEILTSALGDMMNGKRLIGEGEKTIDGVTCKTFALGTDSPEKFFAEQHFAVSPNGNIYTIDVLQGADWLLWVKASDIDPKTAAKTMIDPLIDEAISLMENAKRDDLSEVTYPYEKLDNLDPADKAMYDEMLLKAESFEPFSVTAEDDGYDEIDRAMRVYGAVSRDNPAVENYFVMREVLDGDMTTAIEAHYFLPMDDEMFDAYLQPLRYETELFEGACDRIIERMPEGLSTYDKYYYLAAVISLVTSYDYDFEYGWQTGTAYGAIVGGHSICQGYSRGFMALCQKANLWCEYAEGEFSGTSHMWNLVKLDTGTYHIDITWADEKGLPGSAEWERFFMLTQDEIAIDHVVYDNTFATGTPIVREGSIS
jgi:hypothetical protein